MASSDCSPGEKYPYSTEFNVLDFVPKLSSDRNYHNWESLMRDFIKRQGLVGFIDGTVAAEESKQHDYMAWRRSDNLVQRWILATHNEDTRMRVLCSETAKDMWTELEKIFDARRSGWPLDEEMENRQGRYLALHKAAINGDWDEAVGIIDHDPDAVRAPITPFKETALHLAVWSASTGTDRFVRELLEKMTPQDIVDLVVEDGATALHYAAIVGNVEKAKMLVNKNSDLPNVRDKSEQTPLHVAAFTGIKEIVRYLTEVISDDCVDAFLLWRLRASALA